ncbi:hypothetical protein HDK77DRAFT_481747 [Phyllosticta capitalensis]|uniref:N-acetyltransferase domain-containing protein n=1 Tax=Phyllosticta capitalensis TaxID=121624 RepID=A0ABR1Z4P9_9PEZI
MTVAARETKFYTSEDLVNDPVVLEELFNLVNKAFKNPPNGLKQVEGLRFENYDELLERLGKGICAVMFIQGAAVASASIIPWKGDSMDGDDFEISAVVVDPEYRGTGLAESSVSAVEDAVMSKRSSDAADVRLWLKTAEARNGPYWTRRGFAVKENNVFPAGMWGMEHEFVISTMCRLARRATSEKKVGAQ